MCLLRFKFLQPRTFHELVKVLQGKHLAARGQEHLLHVLSSDPETAASYAGDDLVFRLARWLTSHAEHAQMLNARDLVAGRSVIFCDLRFDDDLWVEFARDDEIRSGLPFSSSFPRKLESSVLNPSGFWIRSGRTI